MLDIKAIRKNPEIIEKKLKSKDPSISLSPLLKADEELRTAQTEMETFQAEQNRVSKEIGEKARKKEDVSSLKEAMSSLKIKIDQLKQKEGELEKTRDNLLLPLPNTPFDEIPVASDPKDNVCIRMVKEKPHFSFTFKNHLELNEKLHLFDFTRSAKVSGSGWPLYTDRGARLEWALLNYMLDIHRKNGFIQIIPPLLVKEEVMIGVGQLPKFANQVFKLQDEDYLLYLIPTAEAVLTGLYYDEILDLDQLPKKLVSYTPCFRREAGAAGKQERGLIRTHQFNKVELYALCSPEESSALFETILKSAEEVLLGLGLHYRNMLLVTGDMSYASAKTIDIEVWLPGQNRYYEVSSVSNCTDFQARRSKIRAKKQNDKPFLVHTLNGSGLATSRLMVGLLENFQQEDGSVIIPEVLHPYLPKEMRVLNV